MKRDGVVVEQLSDHQKRLLYVVHYPIFGGPHNQALRLASPLSDRGWEITVLLPSHPGNAAERLSSAGVPVVQIPLHRLRATPDPRTHLGLAVSLGPEIAKIRRVIRSRGIDLDVVGGLANPHAVIAARLEKVPVVWRIVDSRTPALIRHAMMPLVERLADGVMINGQALIDLHNPKHLKHVPSFVYYPAVDTRQFCISSERRFASRDELGIPIDAEVVGMVANLNPQKGIEHFIHAARIVHRTLPDCYFFIVGARHETHREYTAYLEAECRRSGIPSEQLIFAGGRADVENWYPAMDVKLITSVPRSEGTTTTAMEAMACGVAVVATDVGAVREVVEDGVTGFVVPPLDPEALAAATLRLLDDPALRARMGNEARQRAVERYDVEACADTHLHAFEASISHHASKHSSLPVNAGQT
jgi:glycosyltransferase involved in cell wall biosynthesis